MANPTMSPPLESGCELGTRGFIQEDPQLHPRFGRSEKALGDTEDAVLDS